MNYGARLPWISLKFPTTFVLRSPFHRAHAIKTRLAGDITKSHSLPPKRSFSDRSHRHATGASYGALGGRRPTVAVAAAAADHSERIHATPGGGGFPHSVVATADPTNELTETLESRNFPPS